MTREEQLACLTDRPCTVCKYHDESGCPRWTCVFEEEPTEEQENNETTILRERRKYENRTQF